MENNIRKATKDNAPKLAEIVAYSWQTAYKGVLPDEVIDEEHTKKRIEKLTKYFIKSITNNWCDDFIVNENDVDIGCLSFGLSRDSDKDEYTGELIGLYILGEKRNKGYGCKCLSFVDELSKAKGYTKIILWVLQKNKSAIRFYERYGYTFMGTSRTVNLGEELIEIRLEKILDKENKGMKILSKNQEVIARQEDNEWVLFNPQTSAVHIVSHVGFEIFENCNGENGRKEITSIITNKLQIEETSENQELINSFINDLLKRDIIREVNS